MTKILGISVIDVIPFSKGIIFVKKEALENETVKVSFFSYDTDTEKIAGVTKNVYLLNKFGPAFAPIAQQLGDYVSCDAGTLPDLNTVILYATGEMGIFDDQGALLWTGDLFYHDSPARDVAIENKHIWCAVPEQNSIIRYSTTASKVVMRIGGDKSPTFACPVAVNEYGGMLYVCNHGSMKIRTINLKDFSVRDYMAFDEPVHKYLRVADKEFAVLDSGVYML
ncbi:MAG: hypothetical protein FWF08_02700 [Oscillospiraceae bacterium]|nr:hypothetical protein [Oscillospiraceae bacterium]